MSGAEVVERAAGAPGVPAQVGRLKIVAAATFTAEPMADAVRFWARELGLGVDIEFAAYNQVFQELLDPASMLSRNAAGLNVALVRLEDWGLRTAGDADRAAARSACAEFVAAVKAAAPRLAAPLLVLLCPSARALRRDADYRAAADGLEAVLCAELSEVRGIEVLAPDALIATSGVAEYDDPGTAAHGSMPYMPAFYAALGTAALRKLRAVQAPPCKVLVLDCDQTLWSGVVGEDGPQGVLVDAPRRALQEFALAQRAQGVLLCLCSKNAEADVLAVLDSHPQMLVRREHLAGWRVNWSAKSDNLLALARDLNVGVDSFVFLDDNPLECAEVLARCPGVAAIVLPEEAARIPRFLANLWVFDRFGRTDEDARRAAFYGEATGREALRQASGTFAQFIANLGLEVEIAAPRADQLPRVAQLTQRTNQFNNTTIRRGEAELRQELAAGAVDCLVASVRDRFGDYGLVGAAFYATQADTLRVASLMMSCRALGRGVEHRVVSRLGEIALARDLRKVAIPFAPTAKNQPMLQFLREVAPAAGSAATEGPAATEFELDAQSAAVLRYDPAAAAPLSADDAAPVPAAAAGTAPLSSFAFDAARYTDIASHSADGEHLASRIGAARRRPRPAGGAPRVAPRTTLEAAVLSLLEETLGCDGLSVEDDFFALGGTSLQATVLVNRLQQSHGVALDANLVFDAPSVASLARVLEGAAAAPGPAPMPRAGHSRGPLSFAQQRLWFLEQFNPGSTVYNERRALRLRGPLDHAALVAALTTVVARHEALRTTFPEQDGRAAQAVAPAASVPLPLAAAPGATADAREAATVALIAAEVAQPFDLARGPLLRAGVVRLDSDDHVLWLVFHHIVADGWSVGIMLRELAAAYHAARLNEPLELPGLPVQYLDFAVRQREQLNAAALHEQRAYWRGKLARPPVLEMPADRPRPPVLAYRGAAEPIALDATLVAALRAAGQRQQATLFMTLMAAFQVLLARHSGQDDIVVGFPIANRKQRETEGLVGFFVNTLALRVDLSGNPAFDEALRRVRQSAVEAYAHQDVPFEQLVEDMVPQRDLSRAPIFQAMIAFLDDPVSQFVVPRLAASPLDVPVKTTRFDLLLNLEERDGAIRGALEYSTDLFLPATAKRLVGHLRTLLEAIATDSSTAILEMTLLTPAERAEALGAWAGGSEFHPATGSLHGRFEQQVDRTPAAAALSCEGATLSYLDLNQRANRLAHRLRRNGVGPDVLVGLCAERSLDMVVGILGILKAGGAYVPLDPAYPAERLMMLLEDCGAAVLVAQTQQLESLRGFAPALAVVNLDEAGRAADGESADNPAPLVGPQNLAYVIYTSGSTGKPKGVPISHANVIRLFTATDHWYGFGSGDVWTLFHSFAFDFSVWELWGALLYGGRLVVVPYWVSRSPQAFHDLLRTERVTVLNQTPSAFRQLIQADLAATAAPTELALRYVIFGGEALDLQALRPWFERHGDSRPRLINMYGITETTVHVTYRPVALADLESGSGSVIGEPIPDLTVYLLNPAHQLVPVGVAGEMWVGGAGVARGYLNRPQLTAERFVADRFAPPGAFGLLYRSGDLARRLPGGDLEYLGRIDHQVKIRGFRIELGEIESAISQHPAVREAIVIAREDQPGDKRLAAYVVAGTGAVGAAGAALLDELRALLVGKLPEYMVPAHFVSLAALPLTPNGKVDRKALPAPERVRSERRTAYSPPRSEAERAMARIWCAVLGRPQVGIDDNFFELGGDSILSIQVVARCRAAGIHISPRELFRTPTIAALAAGAASSAAAPGAEDVAQGPVPLTPIQRWFFEQELPEPDHWNQAFVFDVPAELDVDRLEAALRHTAQRHDALRLRVSRTGGEWRQSYAADAAQAPLLRVDLSALPEKDRGPAVTRRATALQAQLRMADGPLLRAAHFDFGPDSPGRLLLAVHHLAIDGVSWRLLLEDLEAAYEAVGRGADPAAALPPRTSSFKRWSESLGAWAGSPERAQALDHWREAVATDAATLPKDGPGGENLESTAAEVVVTLDTADTQDLVQGLPAVYRTQMNDALLTALAQALGRFTGRDALVVELEGHGREDLFAGVDVSRTLGWFTAIYPVRLDTTRRDLEDALDDTRRCLREVPDRGLSYGALRYLGDDPARRALAGHAQPEVIFNYLGQFDQVVAGSSLFRFAAESAGPWHAARGRRRHALEVLAAVRDGRLEARFIFSEALHRAPTIERLAADFADALRALVARARLRTTPRLSPADFPLARLDTGSLQELQAQFPGASIEDVYPLSPMQRLFHSMDATGSTIGLEEWRFEIAGRLDRELFRRSWERVVARHPILRTAFTTAGASEPLQVVAQAVQLPWQYQDLRGLEAAEQEKRLAALGEAEHQRGLELARPPLLRLILAQLQDECHVLLWTTHHLCVDGWSWPIVFSDLTASYAALRRDAAPQLAESCSYARYIEWLAGPESRTGAEEFWKAELAGAVPTPLDLGLPRVGADAEKTTTEVTLLLPPADTRALQALARRERLTLSSIVQAAWALLLGHGSGSDDIVFGAALSGRPAEVPGIGGMVGPCVNNVPVRARFARDEPLVALAARLQQKQPELSQHQYQSLDEIQSWAGVSLRRRLFESLVVFQNYAVDDSVERLDADTRIRLLHGPDATNYPLTLVVVPGASLSLKLMRQPDRLGEPQLALMLSGLEKVLTAVIAAPDASVGRLEAGLDAATRGAAARAAEAPKAVRATAYAAPAGEVEEMVASLWRELFEVERVGLDDNFFDLGGHSLLLVRAHARLAARVPGLKIAALFQNPTVRSLAAHLSGASAAAPKQGAFERAQKQKAALARLRAATGKR